MNNTKPFVLLVGMAILLVFILAVFLENKPNIGSQNMNIPVIESSSDLDKASQTLDSTNVDGMDSNLSQLSSDSNF